MQKQMISLYINGILHQIEIGPKITLLEMLRDAERFVRLGPAAGSSPNWLSLRPSGS